MVGFDAVSSTPEPSGRHIHRSQAERSATTRARLLDATIDALAAGGYARTTTPEVCRRAGVSQGALFKHFPTKAELVSAAAERLFAALIADYRGAFAAAADEGDRVGAAVRLLGGVFRQPRLQAAFELYVAARTDPELAARLRPVAERHGVNLREQARALFPEAPRGRGFEDAIDVVVSALQGAALGGDALRDDARDERLLASLIRLARAALGTA
jgi:AcrR family transcriptional regulator